MRYRHRFELDAPLAEVAAFHCRPESLRAITPRLLPMQVLGTPPPELVAGDELTLRMWLGPLPVIWRSRIEALPDGDGGRGGSGVTGFQDRQTDGPFAYWLHRHRFVALGPHRTAVEDEIEAHLRRHLAWGVIGLKMWLGLPLLFAWRQHRTRRLLGASG